jgi:cytochrome c
MDGFEVNKILGALLGTALLVIAISNISSAIYAKPELKKDAYPVKVATAAAPGAAKEKPKPVDIGAMLAAADVSRGERVVHSVCTSCHTVDKGQPPSTGPNLYGVVGADVIRPEEVAAGFNYSSAMKKFGANGRKWNFDELWHFLDDPRGYVKGTAMTFIGLPRNKQRADVIAYLNQNSDHPLPLPAPKAAADDSAKPAGDAKDSGEKDAKPATDDKK